MRRNLLYELNANKFKKKELNSNNINIFGINPIKIMCDMLKYSILFGLGPP